MSPDLAPFFERRQRFTAAIGDALAVVPGGIESLRNGDVHYEFRQASDFFFLTGFDEPDAVAVINPAHAKERFVLFVRPRDREMEIWNGRRAGTEGAIATYGADAAYTIDQLDAKLREYAVERPVLYYRLGNHAFDARITRLVAELRGARSRGFPAPVRIEDPGPLLHDLRLRKTPAEIARLSRACAISRDAHAEAMRYARPGMHEYEVQAALEYVFRVNGSSRNAYPSIVASGPNACILHYVENTRRMADGDLLLIDAGCEYGYMAADITRTFPVNGRFSGPQRAVYEIVLRPAEASVDRKRARDVGRHVAVLAAGVDQQEVAVRHAPRVLDVVQDARVGSRRHDRRVGVARGAVDAKDVLERRLHLVLVHPRPGVAHGLGVGVAADRARAAQARDLRGRLAQPQVVQQRARILDPHRSRETPRPRAAQLGDEPRDPDVEGVVAEPVIEGGPLDGVLAQLGVELIDRVGGVGAVGRDGALGARAPAVPDLHLAVARPHEEHEALLRVRRVDHGDGVWFVEAGEEEEVARLPELVVDVAVAQALDATGNHGQRVADRGREALAALEEGRQVRAHVPLIP